MKPEEMRDLSAEEIDQKVDHLKKEFFLLRVQAKTGKLEKQNRIQAIRKEIARFLTVKAQIVATK